MKIFPCRPQKVNLRAVFGPWAVFETPVLDHFRQIILKKKKALFFLDQICFIYQSFCSDVQNLTFCWFWFYVVFKLKQSIEKQDSFHASEKIVWKIIYFAFIFLVKVFFFNHRFFFFRLFKQNFEIDRKSKYLNLSINFKISQHSCLHLTQVNFKWNNLSFQNS